MNEFISFTDELFSCRGQRMPISSLSLKTMKEMLDEKYMDDSCFYLLVAAIG
jgi:hypothetical protein